MTVTARLYRLVKLALQKLIDPLRVDDELRNFTLSIPEAQTTTVDSVQGWRKRPPAVLECPGCEAPMHQQRSTSEIVCSNCWRSFSDDKFSEHKLLDMICPRCEAEMDHGIRHPMVFDKPEWATCPDCQYHWDLDHWF